MMSLLKNSLFLCFSIFMLLNICCSLSAEPRRLLPSCFSNYGVSNFTVYPIQHNDSAAYFELLDLSIQNLRYSEDWVPKPVAIVLPGSKEQLVSSVYCCRQGGFEIRVRCGGHSYEGTSSASMEGSPFVLIDLINLNRVSVDLETETAWVEGGATLGQTYYAIAESTSSHGFSAGSCPTVGVGGHISGGGFGLLSRKYGLAADNVMDVILVDADGHLFNRKTMGEDIFWALRGGGGGVWGIVYAWKIKLLKVPETVTGFIISRPGTKHSVARLIHKWQHIAPKLDHDFYLSAFVGAGLPEMKHHISISATFKGFYLGSKDKALSILKRVFPELEVKEQDCMEMTWIESVLYFSGLDEGSSISDLKERYLKYKGYFKAKSDYVKKNISLTGINTALEILEKEPKGYVILDPYGGIMDNIGSGAIAFPHREGNLFCIQYLVEWNEKDDKHSNEYLEWIRGFYDSMTPYVSKDPRAAYVNYIDLDLGEYLLDSGMQDHAPSADAVEVAKVWGEKYFLKNYNRLVEAKTIIDPNNIFRNQQSIPPIPKLKQKSLVQKNNRDYGLL